MAGRARSNTCATFAAILAGFQLVLRAFDKLVNCRKPSTEAAEQVSSTKVLGVQADDPRQSGSMSADEWGQGRNRSKSCGIAHLEKRVRQ